MNHGASEIPTKTSEKTRDTNNKKRKSHATGMTNSKYTL